jgi:hypothetical protein
LPPTRIDKLAANIFLGSGLVRIAIPSTVKVIERLAFGWCEWLRDVTFEHDSTVTRLDGCAFFHCSIHTIALPRSLEAIGKSCFAECENLCDVLVERGSRLASIDEDAFANTGVAWIVVYTDNLRSPAVLDCGCDIHVLPAPNDDFLDFYLD